VGLAAQVLDKATVQALRAVRRLHAHLRPWVLTQRLQVRLVVRVVTLVARRAVAAVAARAVVAHPVMSSSRLPVKSQCRQAPIAAKVAPAQVVWVRLATAMPLAQV
jgi:hypothetical protein